MSFKMRLCRFARTVSTMNLCSCAVQERLDMIRRKARRFEVLRHTAGTLSTYGV
jgi:hypothetical protein